MDLVTQSWQEDVIQAVAAEQLHPIEALDTGTSIDRAAWERNRTTLHRQKRALSWLGAMSATLMSLMFFTIAITCAITGARGHALTAALGGNWFVNLLAIGFGASTSSLLLMDTVDKRLRKNPLNLLTEHANTYLPQVCVNVEHGDVCIGLQHLHDDGMYHQRSFQPWEETAALEYLVELETIIENVVDSQQERVLAARTQAMKSLPSGAITQLSLLAENDGAEELAATVQQQRRKQSELLASR